MSEQKTDATTEGPAPTEDAQVMTEKERAVLTAVRDSDYHDSQDPVGNPVWSNCLAPAHVGDTHVSTRAFPGVVASLAKKGWVVCSGGTRHERTVALTQPGADALTPPEPAPVGGSKPRDLSKPPPWCRVHEHKGQLRLVGVWSGGWPSGITLHGSEGPLTREQLTVGAWQINDAVLDAQRRESGGTDAG